MWACGSVKTIHTCPPQTSNSGASSALRLGKVDGLPLSNKLHAFVEYESIELAERAVAELNDEGNWRSGLWVRLMHRRMSKPSQGRGKKGLDVEVGCDEDYTSVPEPHASEKQLEDASFPDTQLHEHAHMSVPCSVVIRKILTGRLRAK
ncbi:la-related protein 6B isoform X1 [Vigna angularis]|uniref:la-related protein 6B isoform X1 n=1 Tax=Phaseolus angularis TaxID=3914 RepID=UPI0022B2AEA1|nr:la-related protein 6B isoform X1 [Vigna angularis]